MKEIQSRPSLAGRTVIDLELRPVELIERMNVPAFVARATSGKHPLRFTLVNDALVRLLGYGRDELMRGEFWRSCDRDQAALEGIAAALRSGRTVAMATNMLCKDGSRKALRVEMVAHEGSWGLWVVGTVICVAEESGVARASTSENQPARLTVGDLTLDVVTRRAQHGSRWIELTPSESVVLASLMREVGCAVERRALLKQLWGTDPSIRSRAIDVYVGSLRRKLRDLGAPELIHTVRGVGYLLADPTGL